MGIWVIFAPKTLLQLGYSEFQIGLIFAITPLVRFISPFLFLKKGTISKNIFILSSVFTSVSSIFFIFSIDNFILFTINITIFSIFWVVILPYADSIALERIPAKKYGIIRLFGSIGFMCVGISLGAIAHNQLTIYTLYVLFSILTTLFCFYLAKFDLVIKTVSEQTVSINSFSPKAEWRVWLSMFLLQFSFGAFYNFFTIYEISNGFSLQTTTYLWSFGVLCEIFMFIFQGKFIEKFKPIVIIKFATFATAIRWLILYLFPNSVIASFTSQSFHALNFALYSTAVFLYLANQYSENKKLAQMFFYGITYGLGGFLGAIFSGYFYSEEIFLYSSAFAMLAFISFYLPKASDRSNFLNYFRNNPIWR